jgi:hypothetical protein
VSRPPLSSHTLIAIGVACGAATAEAVYDRLTAPPVNERGAVVDWLVIRATIAQHEPQCDVSGIGMGGL